MSTKKSKSAAFNRRQMFIAGAVAGGAALVGPRAATRRRDASRPRHRPGYLLAFRREAVHQLHVHLHDQRRVGDAARSDRGDEQRRVLSRQFRRADGQRPASGSPNSCRWNRRW